MSVLRCLDLVLFLTARPTFGSTIAFAGSCQDDSKGRSIGGQVNWGPAQLSLDSAVLGTDQISNIDC